MECKKCGTLIDEGVFCSICGSRIDGKKQCPKCNMLIKEDAIYCIYCGERVDGKSICSNCGKELEGEFCAFCGTSAKQDKKKSELISANTGKVQTNKIFNIVSSSCLLVAIIILFAFSFCMGTSNKIYTGLPENTITTNPNIWYFLFNVYKNLQGVDFVYLLPYIVCTVAISLNFIIGIIMLILSSIKFYKGFNKEQTSISKFFITSFVCYSAVLVSLLMTMRIGSVTLLNEAALSGQAISKLNGASIAGFVVALVLAIASIVLKYISSGKEFWTSKTIVKKILLAIGLTISIVMLFITIIKNYEINHQEEGIICLTANGFMYLAENFYRASLSVLQTNSYYIPATYFLSYLTGLFTIVTLLVVIYNLMSALFNETNCSGAVVFSSILSTLSLIWLVLSILAKDDFIALQIEMGGMSALVNIYATGAIIAFILSLILLTISIVCKSLSKPKQEL